MLIDSAEFPRRPAVLKRQYVKLRQIFPADFDPLTNSRIARVCVLFEDLRIEITGMYPRVRGSQESCNVLSRLDTAGSKFRELYFLRRSIGTCVEFAEALRLLDEAPSFKALIGRFSVPGQGTWCEAVKYFRQHEKFWKEIRNDVGGHFGSDAAKFAVESFLPGAEGSIEIHDSCGKGGVILAFASEIVATALLRHLPGRDANEKVKALLDEVVTAYPHAVKAVECIVIEHMWRGLNS